NGLAGLVDFFTVNVSSPNTPGLRALQEKASLEELLNRVRAARDGNSVSCKTPIFLKISPDLTDEDVADIVSVTASTSVDGLIVSNTTIERPSSLVGPHIGERGGLSGAPIFERSTRLLAEIAKATRKELPLVGVGGVSSARDAYEKILNGASLVQLYTALVYKGPGLVKDIIEELPVLMKADGYQTVDVAIGGKL
ncbi:MAG: dihydroorotate dehydrogenase (quinone), partial [Pseudomonadota bacterium]